MAQERWEIDSAHSGIHFSVRHLVIAKVRGQFSRWSGFVLSEDGDPARSTVDVTIDASSIATGVEDRDAHLRSADFFDVARFPEIRFTGTNVEGEGSDLKLTGDLTMHGVTRPVTLQVEDAGRTKDPWGNTRAAFSAKATVDRKEFGLTWNQLLETGGVAVGDKITIELEVEAVKQAAAAKVA